MSDWFRLLSRWVRGMESGAGRGQAGGGKERGEPRKMCTSTSGQGGMEGANKRPWQVSVVDGGVFDPEPCPRMPDSPALVSASLPFRESVGPISRRSARLVHPSSSSSRFTLNVLLVNSNHLQRTAVDIHYGRR